MLYDETEALTALGKLPPSKLKPVEPEAKGSTWGGVLKAVGGAVPAAAAEVGAAVVKLGTAAPEGSSASGGRTEQIGQEVERSLRNVAESYAPDPETAGKAEQIIFGLTRGVGKAVGYGLTTGPAAPFLFGVDEGLTEREKLIRQGVDEATAGKVGAVTGLVNTAGFAIPVAGSTVARTMGLAALSGPASFVAQQSASQSILANADYDAIAQTYDPTDAWGLGLSMVPFGFGAWAMRGRMRGAKPAEPKATDVVPMEQGARAEEPPIQVEPVATSGVSPDIPARSPDVVPASPDVPARVMPQEYVDAAMVQNLTDFAEGVRTNPPEKFDAELQRPEVIENPNFKAWFGESKIVDEQGKPLVMFHVTDQEFDSFRTDRPAFFGMSESLARMGASPGVITRTIPAYIAANNPVNTRDTPVHFLDVSKAFRENLFADAVWVADEAGVSLAVRNPALQVKSAVANSGRFDPNSKSLTDPIPVTAKEPAANVPPPQELGTQAREAPKPEGQAQGKAAEGQADPALMQSVRARADEVAATAPDLVVGLAEDGSPITAKDALERIRREAQNGTDDELGAIDAPLVKIAMECALRFGE